MITFFVIIFTVFSTLHAQSLNTLWKARSLVAQDRIDSIISLEPLSMENKIQLIIEDGFKKYRHKPQYIVSFDFGDGVLNAVFTYKNGHIKNVYYLPPLPDPIGILTNPELNDVINFLYNGPNKFYMISFKKDDPLGDYLITPIDVGK